MGRLPFILVQLLGLTYCTDCPGGWIAFNGSCYLVGSYSQTFTEAEGFCRQHGARLVHVETRQENQFLEGFIQTNLKSVDYWIGMTDEIIEGVWRWYGTYNNIGFSDWGPTEPQNDHNEDCAVYHHSLHYHWADVPCGSHRKALCEKSANGELTGVIG